MIEREEFESYLLENSDLDVTDIDWTYFENEKSLEENLEIQEALCYGL